MGGLSFFFGGMQKDERGVEGETEGEENEFLFCQKDNSTQ